MRRPHLLQHIHDARVALQAVAAQVGQHHAAAHGVHAQKHRRLGPVARYSDAFRRGRAGGREAEYAFLPLREGNPEAFHQAKRHIQIGSADDGAGYGERGGRRRAVRGDGMGQRDQQAGGKLAGAGAVHLIAACGQKAAYLHHRKPVRSDGRARHAASGLPDQRLKGVQRPAEQRRFHQKAHCLSPREKRGNQHAQGGGTGMHMALCRRRVCDGLAGRRRGRHDQRAILQAHFTAQGAHAVDHGQGIVAKRCGKAVQAAFAAPQGSQEQRPVRLALGRGNRRAPAEARGIKGDG